MDEASRGLSKGSLKRFLGVLCHPGASPAPLAEPALAAGGSCASSSGTWEQTPLFSAALGAAEPPARGAGAGVRAAFPLPGEESRRASWPAQISLCLGTRFWVRGMWRARAPPAGLRAGRLRGHSRGEGAASLWPFPGDSLAIPSGMLRSGCLPGPGTAGHKGPATRSPRSNPSSPWRLCRGCSRAPALRATLITFPN